MWLILSKRIIFIFYIILIHITLSSLATSQNMNISDVNEETEILIDTLQGKLLGSILKSRDGRNFYSFRGIPFAVKPERFEPSKLGAKWTGIRNAKQYGSQCAQFFGTPEYTGLEDCLFLNVHSPNINPGAHLSVMVWIHGGGFQAGAGSDHNPDYFMDEDVVLVTFNYRLGVLGFLSTGDDIVPGNNGMKDQVTALQWVNKHINSFGGSPDKVTIFGNSAGGASVEFLMMSKLSKGLFHRSIAMSGSALNPWATQKYPATNALHLGKKLICSSTNATICIRKKDLKSILTAQNSFMEWSVYPMSTFSVVVESSLDENALLTNTPYYSLKSGSFAKVPYMIGFNSDEGVYATAPLLYNEELRNQINEDFENLAPISLMYQDSESKDIISHNLKEFYMEGKPLEMSTWDNYSNLYADRWVYNGILVGANLIARHTKVYPYVFSYEGNVSAINTIFGVPGFHGVGHVDEQMYLFPEIYKMPRLNRLSEAGKMSVNFIKCLVTFAKTGVANPWGKENIWKPLSQGVETNLWYNIKGETELKDVHEQFSNREKFWANLLPLDEVAASFQLQKNNIESKTEL